MQGPTGRREADASAAAAAGGRRGDFRSGTAALSLTSSWPAGKARGRRQRIERRERGRLAIPPPPHPPPADVQISRAQPPRAHIERLPPVPVARRLGQRDTAAGLAGAAPLGTHRGCHCCRWPRRPGQRDTGAPGTMGQNSPPHSPRIWWRSEWQMPQYSIANSTCSRVPGRFRAQRWLSIARKRKGETCTHLGC